MASSRLPDASLKALAVKIARSVLGLGARRKPTRAGDALDVGLPVGLGADWLPSGSTSLLAGMKVARQELANQNHLITASELVAMVTTRAAEIAGLADKLGRLEIGRPADVLVLARCDPEPYESVCAATPNDVELVLIGGGLAYGRTDWIAPWRTTPTTPTSNTSWPGAGRPMLLDTSYQGQPDGDPTPRLSHLRADLTNSYPPSDPSGPSHHGCHPQVGEAIAGRCPTPRSHVADRPVTTNLRM